MITQLRELGYYIGRTEEIVNDFTEFQYYIDLLKDTANNKDFYYSVRQSVTSTPEGYEFPFQFDIKDYPERKRLIETAGVRVTQQWYQLNSAPMVDGYAVDLRPYFRKLTIKIATQAYPELHADNIHHNDAFTLFEKGDFINSHVDGQNPGRLFVLLLYLSDEQDWNDGGGELIISDNGNYERVKPFKGAFTLLDFKTHNIEHSVESIKNNFRRFTYLNFVYNKDTMEKDNNEQRY
jgi:Rps23 Pro-64 3,4-dihydroxylase Tpa1-like proline 4-hydroxylase